MNTYQLSFGTLAVLDEHTAEVIVDEGEELDLAAVDEYHAFLATHLKPPICLLINKLNGYTYTFEAQLKIGDINGLCAMAILTYNRASRVSTQNMAALPRQTQWNMEIFEERETALAWLAGQAKTAKRR